MKKILVVGIILLFIDVSVTPGINQCVAKATQEDDTVEVTSQICGIKGYGDITVKLSREQYENLEQYLVEFRTRLNQTATRDEAVPVFRDAVAELDKYGLLPKGMSIEEAKHFVTRQYGEERMSKNKMNFLENLLPLPGNALCLMAGQSTRTYFIPLNARVGLLLILSSGGFLYTAPRIFDLMIGLIFLISSILPPTFLSWILFGNYYSRPVGYIEPASGWLSTIGVNGVKTWEGDFTGGFLTLGVIGFSGIKLYVGGEFTYFGVAPLVMVEMY